MKHLILPILIFTTLTISSQKPIKITTEIDAFTGDTSISTGFIKFQEPLGGNIGLMFTCHYQEGTYYLASILAMDNLATMDAGDQMVIKLQDGTFITLLAADYAVSSYNGNGSYTLITAYPISIDDLTRLSATPITRVRIQTSEGNKDRDPSPKNSQEACRLAFAQFVEAVIR